MAKSIRKYAEEHGLKIEDAKAPMSVTVEADDVAQSKRKKHGSCAMARACVRQHAGVKRAFFFATSGYLQFEKKIVRFALPESVTREIVAFDRSKKFEPGDYRLVPWDKHNTLAGNARRRKKAAKNHHVNEGTTKRQNRLRHETTNVRSRFDLDLDVGPKS